MSEGVRGVRLLMSEVSLALQMMNRCRTNLAPVREYVQRHQVQPVARDWVQCLVYRGTSLIRNSPPP